MEREFYDYNKISCDGEYCFLRLKVMVLKLWIRFVPLASPLVNVVRRDIK